ncbi:MAG: M20/M25/M40 family metallo-hydrolase [Candidatus Bipolaricaulaceae bacterium]
MEDLVELFCQMVRISSESGEEEEFLRWLAGAWTEDLGAECERDQHGNLIARLPARGSTATPLLLCAHADTVRPGKGIEPVVENGVIRSAGDTVLGADDKAGILAIWRGAAAADPRPPLELVVTRQEEVGLQGAKHLDFSRLRAKRAYVVDGDALDEVVVGGPSHFLIDVTVNGRAAHAGMEPEKGISAVKAAAKAIARLPEGRIDGQTTANVGVVRGGEIRNGVPARATVQAECRSLDHRTAEQLAETYRETFVQEAAAVGARAEVEVTLAYRAASLPPDEPVVGLARRALESLGVTPHLKRICGGTDGSILNMHGIRTAVLGMGARGAHTPDEHIRAEDLKQTTELVRTLVQLAATAGQP